MSINAQNAQILAHLEAGKTITWLDALQDFRCSRLAARVYDLKQEGHKIDKEMVKVGEKRVARYWLEPKS